MGKSLSKYIGIGFALFILSQVAAPLLGPFFGLAIILLILTYLLMGIIISIVRWLIG